MKNISLLLVISLAAWLMGCSPKEEKTDSIDKIIESIEMYQNKTIYAEGTAVHLCGVDKKKLKLRSDGGKMVKVIWSDSTKVFDKNLKENRIWIKGKVVEARISVDYVNKMEQSQTLLCHVDHSPCKDSAWVNQKIESGKAPGMSAKDIRKLRDEMESTEKDYVSVITIIAEEIGIVNKSL